MKKKICFTLLAALTVVLIGSCASTGPVGSPKVRLLINPIKAEKGTRSAAAADIEKALFDSLKKLKGENCNCILYHKDRNVSLSVNRHLTGSLAKIESSFFLTIRIIDGEKSRIIFSTSKIIKNKESIKEIIEETAEEIYDKKTVWR